MCNRINTEMVCSESTVVQTCARSLPNDTPSIKLTGEARVSNGARKKVKRHSLQSCCRRRFAEKFKFIIVDRTAIK